MKLHLCYELDQAQKDQWEQFWYKCRHAHPRQHFLFGQVERAKGRIPVYAMGEINGSIVCLGIFSIKPLLSGKKLSLEAICLRGPSFDDITYGREFLLQIISRFKTLCVGSIRISPYWIFPEADKVLPVLAELGFSFYSSNSSAHDSTGLVDLQRSNDDIFSSLSKSTRREIRRAERQNITVRPTNNSSETEIFFQRLNQMNRERGIIPVSHNEFKATFQYILGKQQLGVLLNSFAGQTFLGGLWIIRSVLTAHTARYVVAPNPLKELSNLSIGPLLWWSGIKWAKEKGCLWLNVEGYADNADPSDTKYFVYKFKKKFKPQPVYILKQHIHICQPFVYSMYKGRNFLSRGWYAITGLLYKIKKKTSIRKLLRKSAR